MRRRRGAAQALAAGVGVGRADRSAVLEGAIAEDGGEGGVAGDSTRDQRCVDFLQWALPRLGLRWAGFRKVRRQVCRRVRERAGELELGGLERYREWLEEHPEEWSRLDRACRATISRFHRDRGFFALVAGRVLPELAARAAAEARAVAAWSAGCASGEEAYTLALAWRWLLARGVVEEGEGRGLTIVATDVDLTVLARARRAVYSRSSLHELPAPWRRLGMSPVEEDRWRVEPEVAGRVALAAHDLRRGSPGGRFDLVLCRNLAFTYFGEELREWVAEELVAALRPGGVLGVGSHERLPERPELEPWGLAPELARRR